MRFLFFVAFNIIETLLRFFPFPCKTGMIKIGNPGPDSPVFLTGNYHLTVQRVKRALSGIDAYLLVANSRGINIWCAAEGGHLTNHDVISALKTSGIERLVNRRKVILPQLAATGIETQVVQKKSGWKIIWGPVYAKDIPDFMKNKLKKSLKMRKVDFSLWLRLEMATAWAFPVSLILGFIVFLFSLGIFIPLVLLIWALSFIIFISFPVYSSWLSSKGKIGEFSLLLWGIILFALGAYSILAGDFSWKFFFRWGLLSLIVVFILSFDLKGSTPLLKSDLLQERWLRITIDEEKCKGAAICEKVCPRNCYQVDRNRNLATLVGAEWCVQCGACILQCPFDALYFKRPDSKIILPENIRKYKLNILGKRLKKST